jgi:dipeptidyl aminopeptidase/acylaminoacyl peptidase
MDDIAALRTLVPQENAEDTAAKSEVWRRLSSGTKHRSWSARRRVALASGSALVLLVVTAVLAFRILGAGVETAEAAACAANDSAAQCARALATVLLPSGDIAASGAPRRLAFSAFTAPTRADIYTMNRHGGDVRRLTTGRGMSAFPAWSPDGRLIVFNRVQRGGPSGIYMMDDDGSNQRILARGPWAFPAWSPDGSRIAFWRGDGIYIVGRDGADLRLVVRRGWSPSWSPDGQEIVYSGTGEHANGIYVMNADGSDRRLIAYGSFPAWSRDGKTIAYHGLGQTADKTHSIWLTSPEGLAKRRLRERTWVDCPLAWSPEGELAFSNPSGLYLARLRDGEPTKLGSGRICGVAWQPGRQADG